jgi:chemotaxis protein methyltransferase CheR
MNRRLPDALLGTFGEFVGTHLGLHFPPERAGDLRRGLGSAAREFGFDEAEACARWLLARTLSRDQIEILAAHLTVGETYFFRDRRVFEELETHVLPELIRQRRAGRRLRLWSAACCSGEEAYSLAISLRRVLPDLSGWNATLLGTDLNPRFLHKAVRGIFTDWSFRETPPGFRESHFARLGDGRWELSPGIRGMVTFAPLNLAGDPYPSLLNGTNAVDLILCRNVLFYFTPERALQVIRGLAGCLVAGGWLVLGPNDAGHLDLPELEPVRFSGAVFHRKVSAESLAGRTRSRAGRRPANPAAAATGVRPEPAASPDEIPSCPLPELSAPPVPVPAGEPERESDRAGETEPAISASGSEGLSPDGAEVPGLLQTARAFANQGRLDAALDACDRALAADRMNAAAHHLRASILHELGNPREAAGAFRRALYLEPGFVPAHLGLGQLARAQGRFPEARRHFGNALALVRARPAEEILPEADGLTAGRLAEIIEILRGTETAAPAGAGLATA